MAAERPKRRITQPCLEYNGGLLHKEEIMLRRALYASLTESKKAQQSKVQPSQKSVSNGSMPGSGSCNFEETLSSRPQNEHCTGQEDACNNHGIICKHENVTEHELLSASCTKIPRKKKKRTAREPGKLLNYVIKKKKKKIVRSRTALRTPSPKKPCMLGEDDYNISRDGKYSGDVSCEVKLKKRKRQRGALAVFVAMNKSIGGRVNNGVPLNKDKNPKKRRRLKRRLSEVGKSLHSSNSGTAKSGEHSEENQPAEIDSEGSPAKKSKKEYKKAHKVIHAQRKFAKTHPLSPRSLKKEEDTNHLLTTVCSRAKTEDFLTFLCLRNNPFLPRELEMFNNPCLPMSPLSEEDEDNSYPPSPTQSQSSISNSSNPSSVVPKSSSDSPALSVDSPAVSERPCWESGVVRMFADGPKGLAGEGKMEKKFDELLPSDEPDDPKEVSKSVTPPLSFRVSPRPTVWIAYGAKEKPLPRPIPKPVVLNSPSVTGDKATVQPSGTSGHSATPLPPPLITPSQGKTCCSPPPLLYIPAAAQRVTHLHGPPMLQRYPSTSPTRDKPSQQHKSPGAGDDGPPPLKRFPPITIDDEPGKHHCQAPSEQSSSSSQSRSPDGASSPSLSHENEVSRVLKVDADNSSTSLSDRTLTSELEKLRRFGGEEMPHLKRHSSTSATPVGQADMSGKLSVLVSRITPPRLQRIPVSVETASQGRSSRLVSSCRAGNVPFIPPTLPRHGSADVDPYSNVATAGTSSRESNRPAPAPPVLEKTLTKDRGVQSFPEGNCFRPIPVCEPPASLKFSKALHFNKEKWRSTYVFSSRQTCSSEWQPKPLHMMINETEYLSTSPLHHCSVSSSSHGEVSLARSSVPLPHVSLESSRSLRPTSTHSQANECSPSSSSSGSVTSHPANTGQSSSQMTGKRIPSPRSELLGNVSLKPVQNFTVYPLSSASSGDMSMTLRSTARQKGHSLPPVWSHMQTSYSTTTAPALPRPYTFSVAVPKAAPPPLYSVACALSHSDPSHGALNSLEARVPQRVPVIRHSRIGVDVDVPSKDFMAKDIIMQPDLRFNQPTCVQTHPLPSAFQNETLRTEPKSNATLAESSTPVVERSSPAARADHVVNNVSKNTSSSPLFHTSLKKSAGLKVKGKTLLSEKETLNERTPTKSNSLKIPKNAFGSLIGRAIDSPVFHPSEEEFQDPAAYIKAIRSTGEKFGACIIVPPESWKPEFQVPEGLRFNSECQLIHRLLHRWGPVEEELTCIRKHLEQQSISLTPMPQIGGCELDLAHFSRVVKQFGGLQKVIDNKKWKKVADMLRIPRTAQDRVGKLQDIYCKYLLSYDLLPEAEKADLLKQVNMEREKNINSGAERDFNGWTLKGRNMSLVPFQRLARNMQGHLFKNAPSTNDIEREFWRVVHKRESYVAVHRGTVDTNQEFNGFSSGKGDLCSKHQWNLNVLPHVSGSVLKHLGFVHGVTVPWLQFDMTFSVKSWQMHPLALFIVDYLHTGASKIWYIIPACEKKKFISVLKSFSSQHDLDSSKTEAFDKMVSPSTLKDSDVTVTRVVQEQGQFLVVFPEAYYSSISCGYSISEAVAYAPPDWIIVGSQRYEEMKESCHWSDITFDKLLLGLAEELNNEDPNVVECVLTKLKSLRDEEKASMSELLEVGLLETQALKANNSSEGKKGNSSCVLFCEDCDRPCYLSAVTSEEEPLVLCLKHAAVHIREKKSSEGFRILNRYDTVYLDELVDKIESRLKKLTGPS